MRKNTFIFILAIMVIACLFSSCNARSIGIIGGADGPTSVFVADDKNKEEQNIDKLYEFKTDYVGDNSKVGNILVALDRLLEMPFDNFERTFEITENNGIIINYKVDDRGNYRNLDYFHFDKTAAVLFGLIGNLEHVSIRVYDEYSNPDEPDSSFFGCTYFEATLSERQITKDFTKEKMRSASETKEGFREYMKDVLKIEFPKIKRSHKEAVNEHLGETEEIVKNSLAIFEIKFSDKVTTQELSKYMPAAVDLGDYNGKTLTFHLYDIRDYVSGAVSQHIFVFEGSKVLAGREFLDEKEAYCAKEILIKLTEGASE